MLFEYVKINLIHFVIRISSQNSLALCYRDLEGRRFCYETLLVTNVRNLLPCELKCHVVRSAQKMKYVRETDSKITGSLSLPITSFSVVLI
jgi:hypothetical protein